MGTQSQINIQKHPKTQALQKLSTVQTSNLHTRIIKLYTIACMGPPQGRGRNCEQISMPVVVPRRGRWGIWLIGALWDDFGTSLLRCSAPAHGNLGLSVAILGASVQIGMSLCQLVLAMIHIVIEQPGYKANTHIDTTHIKHFMNWHTRLLHDG